MTGHVYAIGSEWVEFYWDSEGRCRSRVVERKYPPKTDSVVETEAKTYKHTRTRAQRRAAKRARRTRGKR